MGPPPGQSLVQREVPYPHHTVWWLWQEVQHPRPRHCIQPPFLTWRYYTEWQPWSSRFFVFFLVNVAVSFQEHRIGG